MEHRDMGGGKSTPGKYTLTLTDVQLLDVLGAVGTMRDLLKDKRPEDSARLTALEDNIAAQTGAMADFPNNPEEN